MGAITQRGRNFDEYAVILLPEAPQSRAKLDNLLETKDDNHPPLILESLYLQLPSILQNYLQEATRCIACGQYSAAVNLAWKAVELGRLEKDNNKQVEPTADSDEVPKNAGEKRFHFSEDEALKACEELQQAIRSLEDTFLNQ